MLALVGCGSAPTTAPPSTPSTPSTTTDAAVVDASLPPHQLTATFGDTRAPFERAFYGVGAGKLHVEAIHGGDAACPTMSSPTPERTVVIAGLPVGFTGKLTHADGVRASLLDFKGTLTKEPILRATAVTATASASGVDFVAFDLQATYPGGTIAGHVHATHCASMDS